MTLSAQEIPVAQAVVDDKGKMTLPWILFNQQLLVGDQGNKFTPNINGLTTVGTPKITGVYYENSGFIDFYVSISPGTSTTSTAGTTYIQLPFAVVADAPCFAVNGNAAQVGGITASNNRCYPPAWNALTTTVTVSGRVKTQ